MIWLTEVAVRVTRAKLSGSATIESVVNFINSRESREGDTEVSMRTFGDGGMGGGKMVVDTWVLGLLDALRFEVVKPPPT